jgi:hypothetical protein
MQRDTLCGVLAPTLQDGLPLASPVTTGEVYTYTTKVNSLVYIYTLVLYMPCLYL